MESDLDVQTEALDPRIEAYLEELHSRLWKVVPEAEESRLLEETADHLDMIVEEFGGDVESVELALNEFGSPGTLADQYIETWYNKPSRLSWLERKLGPGNVCVLALFGLADLAYLAILQFRVFLPANAAIRLPWSPAEIRQYFPEPLPFPDFSVQFLLMTGIPLLAPPILGWIVGRKIPLRPQFHVYSVMMPLIIFSFILGILLLPVTDGLMFAIVQAVYWLPIGCGAAALSSRFAARERRKQAALRDAWSLPQ